MADLTEVVVYRGGMRGAGLKYLVLEVEGADTNDTVTVDELTTIKDTLAIRLDTGAAITATESTNVVTISEAGLSDVPVLIVVAGT